MSTEIKVPVFPESVTDGTLIAWHKNVGDTVAQDELLAEIETDKVVFEVRALKPGVIEDVLVNTDATVVSDQVIAHMQEQDVAPAHITATPQHEGPVTDKSDVSSMKTIAAPAAEKLIAEQQLNADAIAGTGKHGLILKEDVLDYMQQQKSSHPVSASAKPGNTLRSQDRVPMSRLRARIAERLLEAQHNAAILTTFNEIDMQPVMDLRSKYKDDFEKKHGCKLGFMSFFVKAAVEALKHFPEVNASIEDADIVYHGFIDIGIAVGSPRGLVVPVLRDADTLSMAQIETTIAGFGERAKNGSLSIEEITGGTFSITNGGVFGSLLSTPILNPPQSAILGMHKIEKRPVVVKDEIVIRPMMYVALSYDHRIIDGREAVQFLVAIKEVIEDPHRLLLQV